MTSIFIERLLSRSASTLGEIRPRAATIFEPMAPETADADWPAIATADRMPAIDIADAAPSTASAAGTDAIGMVPTAPALHTPTAKPPPRQVADLPANRPEQPGWPRRSALSPRVRAAQPVASRDRSERPRRRAELIRTLEKVVGAAGRHTASPPAGVLRSASLTATANPLTLRTLLIVEAFKAAEPPRDEPETVVEVSIGRIEVRATPESAKAPPRQRQSAAPQMRLEEHLRQRAREVR